ncbi:MAG TPA: hypothetical protein VM097_10610 [Mycobacteriales bacterium]|nr:hypothetical protein [Mycobacteriales bacterium]
MLSPLFHVPWALTYVARRGAGASLLLAERVGVAVFPSTPPDVLMGSWAAGYAAGTLAAFDEAQPVAAAAP